MVHPIPLHYDSEQLKNRTKIFHSPMSLGRACGPVLTSRFQEILNHCALLEPVCRTASDCMTVWLFDHIFANWKNVFNLLDAPAFIVTLASVFLVACMRFSTSLCRSVSVYFLGVFRAVFVPQPLPNNMQLNLPCIRPCFLALNSRSTHFRSYHLLFCSNRVLFEVFLSHCSQYWPECSRFLPHLHCSWTGTDNLLIKQFKTSRSIVDLTYFYNSKSYYFFNSCPGWRSCG